MAIGVEAQLLLAIGHVSSAMDGVRTAESLRPGFAQHRGSLLVEVMSFAATAFAEG